MAKKMSEKYNITLVKEQRTKNKKELRKQIEIVRKDGKIIKLNDIENLYNKVISKNINPQNIIVVGLNGERYITLKGLKESNMRNFGDEEYLQNKPKNIRNMLTKFTRIEFIVHE
jgi:hypothetical protein